MSTAFWIPVNYATCDASHILSRRRLRFVKYDHREYTHGPGASMATVHEPLFLCGMLDLKSLESRSISSMEDCHISTAYASDVFGNDVHASDDQLRMGLIFSLIRCMSLNQIFRDKSANRNERLEKASLGLIAMLTRRDRIQNARDHRKCLSELRWALNLFILTGQLYIPLCHGRIRTHTI